jgi:TRAP-type uncharacterized transport system substrate-binding protein
LRQEFRPVNLAAVGLLLFPLSAYAAVLPAHAQQRAAQQQQALVKKHNEAALMMLGGWHGTSYSAMARDIADILSAGALNSGASVRLIAVEAPGGVESLRDLLFLRGIDLAIAPRNVLDYADTTNVLGPSLRDRLTYVTALYSEEIHVLAGAGVVSIKNLHGRKVAVAPEDGNAGFTAADLLRRLQIQAEVVKVAPADAIDDVRSGAIAALVLVGGKPLRFVASLPKDGSLHLLALSSTQVPAQVLGDGYSPGTFDADDYPTLIAGDQTIDTLSVAAVLVASKAAPTDESSGRIARFVPALFSALSELSGPRWHPKWSEVNLAATLDRWQRFPAAQEWLKTALQEQSASVQRNFDAFLRAGARSGPAPSAAQRKQMFEDYLKWTRSTPNAVH